MSLPPRGELSPAIAFPVEKIERPYRTELELGLNKDAILLDGRMILGFRNIAPRVVKLLVARDRAIPVKTVGSDAQAEMWMSAELAGEYGIVFKDPGESFYVGPDYQITILSTAEDKVARKVRLVIDSLAPVNKKSISGRADYNRVLTTRREGNSPLIS